MPQKIPGSGAEPQIIVSITDFFFVLNRRSQSLKPSLLVPTMQRHKGRTFHNAFLSRNSLVTSKNRVNNLDLDLDLDMDLDSLVWGKPSRRNIYQIAPYSVHVHVQVHVQVEVQVQDGGPRSFATETSPLG